MVESKHLFKLEIGHMNSFLENHQYSRLQMALLYSLIPQKVNHKVKKLICFRDAGTDFCQARPLVNSKASKMITKGGFFSERADSFVISSSR